MIDSRIQLPTSKQNEHLYKIVNFNPKFRTVIADYFVMASRITPGISHKNALPNASEYIKFELMKTPLKNMMNIAIIIKEDWCHSVFQKIDWEKVYFQGILWQHIKLGDIHKAFNNAK